MMNQKNQDTPEEMYDDTPELWIIDPEDLHEDDEDEEAVFEYKEIEHPTSLKATVIEMIVGMLLFGTICQLAGVWWVKDKLGYSQGLWLGILMSAGMSVHMAYSYDRAVELDEKSAENRIRMHSIIRYICVVVIFAIMLFSGHANPLAAFLGIMSLKISAYLQPLIHKLSSKLFPGRDK